MNQRYGRRPVVLTTNKPFGEWNEVFPNASCAVTLIDRLIHKSEVIAIDGASYRLHEAQERAAAKAKERRGRSTGKGRN